MSRGGRPRREESERTGRRILEAAAEMFVRDGYRGTSIEKIALAARVGRPTVYARYGSKANLLRLVIGHLLDNIRALPEADATSCSLEDGLTRIVAAIITESTRPLYLGLVRLFLMEAHKFPEVFEAFYATMESEAKQRLVDFVRRHPHRARLTASPEQTATALLEFAHSVVTLASLRPDNAATISPADEAVRGVNTVLFGLLRRD